MSRRSTGGGLPAPVAGQQPGAAPEPVPLGPRHWALYAEIHGRTDICASRLRRVLVPGPQDTLLVVSPLSPDRFKDNTEALRTVGVLVVMSTQLVSDHLGLAETVPMRKVAVVCERRGLDPTAGRLQHALRDWPDPEVVGLELVDTDRTELGLRLATEHVARGHRLTATAVGLCQWAVNRAVLAGCG